MKIDFVMRFAMTSSIVCPSEIGRPQRKRARLPDRPLTQRINELMTRVGCPRTA